LYAPGITSGVIPTNDGLNCIWVGVPEARYRSELAGDISGSYRRLLREVSPDLARTVDAAGIPRPLRSFPGLAGYMRRPWGPGWALVGDAGYYKDPVTAHGMSDALRDAELLANALVATLSGYSSEDDAMREYHEIRNRLSLRLFAATEVVASYQWDMHSIEAHVRAVSAGMVDEVEHILAADGVRAGQ
jgi:2-polyprenyl-6-methoxyphenol hydroxylase-like FAD-dependent oxidoreductase